MNEQNLYELSYRIDDIALLAEEAGQSALAKRLYDLADRIRRELEVAEPEAQ